MIQRTVRQSSNPISSGQAEEGLAQSIVAQPDDITKWMEYFKVCYYAGHISPALSLALRMMDEVQNVESVFRPIARILHVNGLHDAAVRIYEQILQLDPNARKTHSDLLIHRHLCGLDDQNAFDEMERWNARFIRPLLQSALHANTPKDPDRPLRVGFVSNDFGGNHSLNTAMASWFIGKEQRRNTFVLYSNAPEGMPIHQVFLDAADDFQRIGALSDIALDQLIRKDRIDILVDMVGHMDHTRLLAFAHRPAPINVSWIGIGIPTGSEAMDYFLADNIRVPENAVHFYVEKIVSIPNTAMAWCPPSSAPSLSPPPRLRNEFVTFGNLSRIVKFQAETFDLISGVLHRVPDSRFLMKDSNFTGQNVRRIISEFTARGVAEERLIFRSGSNQFDHMAAYNEVDVVLDTYPQQGGVSSLEALWMGVPVVSYSRMLKPTGRVGQFILSNIGLSALAVDRIDAFIETSCFLTEQKQQLLSLRSGLRSTLQQSPICDIAMFQRNIDSAFRTMWRRYCDGQSPEGFSVGQS